MNRLGLRTEAENRIIDPGNAIASDSQINGWINQAIREIGRATMWPFLRVRATVLTVAGIGTVDLPSDCRSITKVSINEGLDTAVSGVIPLSDRWIQHNLDTTDGTRGKPQAYTDGGFKQTVLTSVPVRTLRLWPIPDIAYTLNITYIRRGTVLTDDTHFPPFPEEFDEAILLWTMRQYYRQVEVESNMMVHESAYQRELQLLINHYGVETLEKYPAVLEDYESYEHITDNLNRTWWG